MTLMSSSVIYRPVVAASDVSPWLLIDTLARVMRARDRITYAHACRVQRYAAVLSGEANITDPRMLEAIDAAALLHDIGKLALPDLLLHKPGPLTAREYAQVQQHAAIGADVLSAVPFPGPLALIVRHHHENWDGSGYPDGLRGNEIPLGARVLAIVDCYDALTSDRPYHRSLPQQRAIAMIVERRGTMYEPEIADAFLRVVDALHQAPDRERPRATLRRALAPRRLARVI
jgi:putative nucleotidyltransferase with HDIG domain